MTLAPLLRQGALGIVALLLPTAARAQDPVPPASPALPALPDVPSPPSAPAPLPELPAGPAPASPAASGPGRRLMYVGGGILAGGYAATVLTNLLDPQLHARVFLPLVGPWLVIGQAGTRGDGPPTPLLAFEGLLQAAGLVTLLAGLDAGAAGDQAAIGFRVLPGGGLASLARRF